MSETVNGDKPEGRGHWVRPHASVFCFVRPKKIPAKSPANFLTRSGKSSRYRGNSLRAASASLRLRNASGGMRNRQEENRKRRSGLSAALRLRKIRAPPSPCRIHPHRLEVSRQEKPRRAFTRRGWLRFMPRPGRRPWALHGSRAVHNRPSA
jgi:hypothetical protein